MQVKLNEICTCNVHLFEIFFILDTIADLQQQVNRLSLEVQRGFGIVDIKDSEEKVSVALHIISLAEFPSSSYISIHLCIIHS